MYNGIIYLATSPNGKKYYGQTTSSLERRKKCHRGMLLFEICKDHLEQGAFGILINSMEI